MNYDLKRWMSFQPREAPGFLDLGFLPWDYHYRGPLEIPMAIVHVPRRRRASRPSARRRGWRRWLRRRRRRGPLSLRGLATKTMVSAQQNSLDNQAQTLGALSSPRAEFEVRSRDDSGIRAPDSDVACSLHVGDPTPARGRRHAPRGRCRRGPPSPRPRGRAVPAKPIPARPAFAAPCFRFSDASLSPMPCTCFPPGVRTPDTP